MRGSVIKKGSQWYVKIELDPDPATGRRRQKWQQAPQKLRSGGGLHPRFAPIDVR